MAVISGGKKVELKRELDKEDRLMAIFRKRVKLPDIDFQKNITVSIAKNKKDISDCLKLLHDNYVESNLAVSTSIRMRVLKYHMLPTTFIVMAKYKGEVVGTATLIYDDMFGLPCDKITDIKDYKKDNRVCEISSLAIKKEFKNGRSIMLYLCKYLHVFAMYTLKIDYMFATVHPNHALFYKSLFGFTEVEGAHDTEYDFVENAKAQVLVLDVNNCLKSQRKISGDELYQDEFQKFCMSECDSVKFENPVKSFPKLNVLGLNERYFNYFFKRKTKIYQNLTSEEREQIEERIRAKGPIVKLRISPRYQRREEIHLNFEMINGKVCTQDISETGFSVSILDNTIFDKNKFEPFELSFDKPQRPKIRVKLIWKDGVKAGFKVIDGHENWLKWLDTVISKQAA